ncbi:MAG: response regulator transcription factor [Chitinophagales bacterium]|nr:response regulator transcription factor [Chitinophagales bacterium]
MNALVIDDEERSRRILKNFLANYCPEVNVLGEADDIDAAYQAILLHKPDVVFLDIDMPPYTGFDLLKKFEKIPFEIIFVTAYDYYAIDAIKFSALYYILKPIKVGELKSAIEKAKNKLRTHSDITSKYVQQLNPQSLERIVVNTLKDSMLIDLGDILYLESDNVYSTIYLINGQKVICSQKNLSEYEELLSSKGFFRSHKSYLVNLKQIASVSKTEGGELVLKNKVIIPLARRRREDFFKIF